MGFNDFLSKLFGNKSQRDLKEIMPYVDKIKAVAERTLEKAIDKSTDKAYIKSLVKDEVSRFIYKETKRRPMIIPVLMS